MLFILFFILAIFFSNKDKIAQNRYKWFYYVAIVCVPLAMIAGQAGWIVAEVGRQPWAIQDLLPVNAAISSLQPGAVKTTFFIFLVLFTVLLVAEMGIMLKAIAKGPENTETDNEQ